MSVMIIGLTYPTHIKNTKQCKQKCSLINESYNYSSTDDEENVICYCKPKLNVINGIVR